MREVGVRCEIPPVQQCIAIALEQASMHPVAKGNGLPTRTGRAGPPHVVRQIVCHVSGGDDQDAFVGERPAPRLPLTHEGVCIARLADRIAFTHYRPHPKGPVFMQVLARAFGDDVTTRTWATLAKVVAAAHAAPKPAAPRPVARPRR